MNYIDVRWRHENELYPIRLVSELDADNVETRKLEFFRDGSVGFASEFGSSRGVQLGVVAVPSLENINSDEQFNGVEISKADFEMLWSNATLP